MRSFVHTRRIQRPTLHAFSRHSGPCFLSVALLFELRAHHLSMTPRPVSFRNPLASPFPSSIPHPPLCWGYRSVGLWSDLTLVMETHTQVTTSCSSCLLGSSPGFWRHVLDSPSVYSSHLCPGLQKAVGRSFSFQATHTGSQS